MEKLAACGLICEECPLYIATIRQDEDRKAQLARDYSNEQCRFEAVDMTCEGCFAENRSKKMCDACEIRSCAAKKNVETCGHCAEYPCTRIETYVEAGCDSRKRLDALHGTNA